MNTYAVINKNIVDNIIVVDNITAVKELEKCNPLFRYILFNKDSDKEDEIAMIGKAYISGKFYNLKQVIDKNLMSLDEALAYGFHSGQDEIEESKKVNVVTMRQARLQLLDMGLLDNVEAMISENKAWQIEWEYATEVRRDNPIIGAMVEALSLTEEQLDDMFKQASMR